MSMSATRVGDFSGARHARAGDDQRHPQRRGRR
jgi:hypothetical protein